MRKQYLSAALLTLSLASLAQAPAAAAGTSQPREWPTIERQLAQDRIVQGSNLEGLIYQNQDFSMLRPGEMRDKIGLPPWLRVWWRKAHPELVYSAKDPSGGYPRVLNEVYEWMLAHQDLLPGLVDTDLAPPEDRTTVGANVRVSGAQTSSRSESDIRINFLNPNQVIAASNNISASGRQGQYYSANGGSTWGQTTLPLTATDAFHSDPTVDWRSDGSAWATTIGINSAGTSLKMRTYKSTTAGSSWTFESTFSGAQTSADKQMVWIDHSSTSARKDSIYACWHNGTPAYINRRTAAGAWGAPLVVSGAESTGTAIGCDIKTNSTGEVFVFWPTTTNRRVIVRKSIDGGATWSAAVIVRTMFDAYDIGIPSFASRRALIYTSGGAYRNGATNNVYVAWTDLTGAAGCTSAANEPGTNAASSCKTRIWFSRSTNGGTTWSAAAMINNQAGLNDQFNQALAVDESTGRIAIIYYDTVGDATRKTTNVYYQTSSNGGSTWSAATKVTTASTNETIAGADTGNQYGDYNGLSGWASKFLPSWTDRRSGGKEEIWTAPVTEP
jgi:BNR repeat-like domain